LRVFDFDLPDVTGKLSALADTAAAVGSTRLDSCDSRFTAMDGDSEFNSKLELDLLSLTAGAFTVFGAED
jgi:hypothetical protein